MKINIKKIALTILPIALGIGLIWYSLSKLEPEDIASIKNSFKTANYWWVALSLVLAILSHFSRAYRWQFMLEPLGYKPRFANNVMAVLVAYLVNLIVPRAGEVARATAISKYEHIPFEKAFGTIVSERVADVIMLLGIIGLAFFYQTELLSSYLFKEEPSGSSYTGYVILAVAAILLLVVWKMRKSENPLVQKVQNFVKGLIQGITSIFQMKRKWAFIFHTVFIWVMYVMMFYVVTFALPETTNMPFGAIIVGFVVGGLSMALTNGGLGTYPVFVASAITLYGIEENPALAFGWIMWTAQTLMVLLFGGLSFLVLPVFNRNVE